MLLKVRSFLRAFWSLFREGDASMGVYNEREAQCYDCDRMVVTDAGMFCGACGCAPSPVSDLRTKWRLPNLRCPLNKW